MNYFRCIGGNGGGGGQSQFTYTKQKLFEPAGIGASNWRDDADTINLTLNGGTYEATPGEKIVVNSTNQARFSMPTAGSYYLFGIRCKVDANFTPNNTDQWYNASCILGTELGGEQKDYAIVIDKNGYFALGWSVSNITSTDVSALDGLEHELFVMALGGTILLFIDGVKKVEVLKGMNGSEMYNIGVFWNYSGYATRVNGEIYAVGYWQYNEPNFDYNLPSI